MRGTALMVAMSKQPTAVLNGAKPKVEWSEMELMLWNALLTTFLGLVAWSLKEYVAEQKRLSILLNRTREEIAKEYVTKMEVHSDINRVLDRIDRLEAKIDAFIKESRSALN